MNLRFLSCSVKAVALAMCLAIILMLIFSLISITKEDPDSFSEPFAYICLYVPSVICGYFAAKSHKTKAMPMAFLSGSIFAALIFCVSLFSDDVYRQDDIRWLLYLLILIFAAIGGILGSPKVKKIKHKKRRV